MPALSPTVAVSATPTHVAGGSGGGGLVQILGWIVAVLAFLGAVGCVLYLALNSRRAPAETEQPPTSAPWATPSDNSWGGPQGGLQGGLWDEPSPGSGPTGSTHWGQGPQGSRPDWDAPTEPGRWPGDRQ
jgi:hypothetical protein